MQALIFCSNTLQRYYFRMRNSKIIIFVSLLALIVITILWLFTLSRINFERENEIQSSIRVKLQELRAFEEHSSLNLQAIDQVLRYIKARYEENGVSPLLLQRTQEATNLSNLEKMKSLPKMQSLIIDEKGEVVVSRLPSEVDANYFAAEFSQVHRAEDDKKIYIGKTMLGNAMSPSFTLSRRINKADGSFGGIAAVALSYETFAVLFPQMDFGQEQIFSLVGQDGVIQGIKSDGNYNNLAKNINVCQLLNGAQQNNVGYYKSTGVDNISRIICFRNVPNYPLIAIVSIEEEQVLREFYKRQNEYYKIAYLLSFFIIVTFGIILRMLVKQEKIKFQLKESEERLQIIFDSVQAGIAIIDAKTHKVFDVNQRVLTMIGAEKMEIVGKTCHKFICPAEDGKCPILNLGQNVDNSERILLSANGESIPVIKTVTPITLHGRKYLLESFVDIIERKRVEEELRFLSHHDALTGLRNRAYFEEQLKETRVGNLGTVGIVICDIDGLKLVNDTLGHVEGDGLLIAAAQIIKTIVGAEVVARIGGDEFAIVLPRTTEAEAEIICEKIQLAVVEYNQQNDTIPLSISLGYGVQTNDGVSLNELFKEADNNMYREKLHRSKSTRSDIIQTVMKMLEERDFITDGHADRVEELSANLGRALGLSEKRIGDIRLLAKFHDIGKVGIPDNILFKPGALDADERKEMNRHSEIGYRIAQSSADLLPIADWILKHHEHWDGTGYPLGLAGEAIPLECRILAIVDSYDAMTNDRPYRTAMSHMAAAKELKRCAGTQFDPQLVKKIIQLELREFTAAV